MSAIRTYTQMIKNFGLELDTSDKEYIKTILINIMSMLDLSIVPTEILTMVDEKRRMELLPLLSEVIYFGDEFNGQITDTDGNTICNLHQEVIDPDVLIPLSLSIIKDGLLLQKVEDTNEIDELLSVLSRITESIDFKPLLMAKLKSQALLLDKRAHNISATITRNIKAVNQTLAANEQLKGLLAGTEAEKQKILSRIEELENQSVKQAK